MIDSSKSYHEEEQSDFESLISVSEEDHFLSIFEITDLTEDEIDSKFNSIKWNKKCTNSNKR